MPSYRLLMMNPLIAEELARQHRQDLLAQAARARLARRSGDGGLPWWVMTWRLRAGRSLIRAGEWLAARGTPGTRATTFRPANPQN
jgi:hypothetical protein